MEELRNIIRTKLYATDYEEHLENNHLESIDTIFKSIFDEDSWVELYTNYPCLYVDNIFAEEFSKWDEYHYNRLTI